MVHLSNKILHDKNLCTDVSQVGTLQSSYKKSPLYPYNFAQSAMCFPLKTNLLSCLITDIRKDIMTISLDYIAFISLYLCFTDYFDWKKRVT